MEKEVLSKIIKKRLSEIMDYRYPYQSENYAPETAIWFQRKNDLRAYIAVVNDKYYYQILNIKSRKKLEDGSKNTLSQAKKEVLDYFEKH